ncbi:MAG: 4-hydroxy-tetrahydrodipicolinate synthase [Ilumatobacter sp.]|uniref:4-hydroxy-tetrahydrodipicolinate synthase n=1 Tax=Ilumatobacter sp. TaxID=1967498 RepID=UPI00260EC72C|nr:4-hydroxy-tetrahydrodipicolinate synthase [Ilumatobacter sp.]MDJ0770157.1 4-hydroxy-tetrahydrodipicolinate synthase [Ilumatobacter sp.]
MPHFGRILSALVTPFDAAGAVDYDEAQRLARHLVGEGHDGLVVCGTTGESPTLTDDEKLGMFAAVVEAVDVPVVAGTVGYNTHHAIDLSQQAAKLGVHGILSLCPFYSRPSQTGIEAHFRAIADACDLPQLIYDIPIRTGRKVSSDVLIRLARDVPNIVGVKDAASDPAETARVIAATPDDFEFYSGDDKLTLPFLSVGAVGVVGVATHWTGPDHVEMFDAWERGDIGTAQRVNRRLLESFAFETGDDAPNPIPTKAMMRTLGFGVGECRLPLGPAPAGLEARAREVWANLVSARG